MSDEEEINDTIPKIIHQIWIGPKVPPYIWINTWKNDYMEKHDYYEYNLWDNESVEEILNKYPRIKIIYEKEELYCGKADILRYLILYEYGGIYIDADSVWVNNKCLDYLIDNTNVGGIFAAFEPKTNHFTNGVIGCTKNNEHLWKVIEHINEYTPRRYMNKRVYTGVSKMTGPFLFNSYFKEGENITRYPENYFYPKGWHGIKTVDYHKNLKLPKECYMFQYGLSTNKIDYENIDTKSS